MAKKKIEWTAQQSRAISRRGSDVLVTASAGTGKTAVLSGRCADIAADIEAFSSVSDMLVLTFTDAAAEQMEQRIRRHLQDRLLEQPENKHLQTQLIQLPGADIGTIHSFCRKIILEHFYKLSDDGLDPTFRIIDEDEQQLLKFEALDKTLSWAWQQDNLRQGLVQLFYRRDPKTESYFASKIISLSEFLDGIVGRQNWFERALALAENYSPLTGPLGEKQKQFIADKIQGIIRQVRSAQKLYERHNTKGNWSAKWNGLVGTLEHCIELHKNGNWPGVAEQIKQFKKPRIDKPKDIDETIADYVKNAVKDAVDNFDGLKKPAVLNPDYLDKISSAVSIQTKVFIELVRKFDQIYRQAKQVVNALDFADLEHYALKLLSELDADDNISPSQIARTLRQRYKYIFVDEYQDINPVQEAILKSISRADNVFVVGDVKQSIYAFRGAEPKIFLQNLRPASADPKDNEKPLRVDLNINFRSEKGILDFVNIIFSNIMTSSFAGIDYDEGARLKPVPEKSGDDKLSPLVELHIIEKEGRVDENEQEQMQSDDLDEEQTSLTSRQCQAALIARRIKQMTGSDTGRSEFQIFDQQQNCLRDVRYGDIAILLRSPAKRINDYVKILRLAGIPVSSRGTEGYFEATEITDILSLLKLVDNPQRDIEFASVLRSPFFNFSDSDLAEVKIFAGNNPQCRNFYDSVNLYAQTGPDSKLSGRLKETLERLAAWRTDARLGKLSDLIWKIYRQTRYLSFVSALPSGQQRKANLLKFHDRAIQFENFASSGSFFSLARFVEFIEKLQQADAEWSFAEPEASLEEAVKITSIHKSKGLEFPVVILAELDSRFNIKDCYDDIIADADLTLGLRIVEQESNTKVSSLAHQVIAEQKLQTNLAEEMRILYVATTRARERLILVGSERLSLCRQTILDGLYGEKPLDLREPGRRKNFLQWILLGLSEQKILHQAFEIDSENQPADKNLISLRLYGQQDVKGFTDYVEQLRRSGRTAASPETKSCPDLTKAIDKLKKSINWKYDFETASSLPAKRTVSELSNAYDEFKKIDYSKALERKPKAVLTDGTDYFDSRIVGTATHLLISNLDLTLPVTDEQIERIKQNLVAEKVISPATAQKLNTGSILAFFSSELGMLALDKANIIWREWPFTFSIPAGQWQSDIGETDLQITAADETIIVQGIIDMLIKTDAGLVVIDFKTDNVSARRLAERAQNYKFQIDLYAKAANAVLKTPVVSKWLYFLKPAQAVQIR